MCAVVMVKIAQAHLLVRNLLHDAKTVSHQIPHATQLARKNTGTLERPRAQPVCQILRVRFVVRCLDVGLADSAGIR